MRLEYLESEDLFTSDDFFSKYGISIAEKRVIADPKGYGRKSSNSILNEIFGEISIRTGKISLKLMCYIR